MLPSRLLLHEQFISSPAAGQSALAYQWGGRRLGDPTSGTHAVAPYLTVEPAPMYPLGVGGDVNYRDVIAVLNVDTRVTITLTPIVDEVDQTATTVTTTGKQRVRVRAPFSARGAGVTCRLTVTPTNAGDILGQVEVLDIQASFVGQRQDP